MYSLCISGIGAKSVNKTNWLYRVTTHSENLVSVWSFGDDFNFLNNSRSHDILHDTLNNKPQQSVYTSRRSSTGLVISTISNGDVKAYSNKRSMLGTEKRTNVFIEVNCIDGEIDLKTTRDPKHDDQENISIAFRYPEKWILFRHPCLYVVLQCCVVWWLTTCETQCDPFL